MPTSWSRVCWMKYRATGKVTTRLAPNVTKVLDPETQAALDQLTSGEAVAPDAVKTISSKTRKLTQRLDTLNE